MVTTKFNHKIEWEPNARREKKSVVYASIYIYISYTSIPRNGKEISIIIPTYEYLRHT